LTLTGAEYAELLKVEHRASRPPIADQTRQAGFLALAVGPCPFLAHDASGRAMCLAYDVRPYNCRRFMCGRERCSDPYDPRPIPQVVAFSRGLTAQYERNQERAKDWARAHGWTEDGDEG
jgi:Fe-S-cluster containining protein